MPIMVVCVLCQGFDEEQEVHVHGKWLKTLIRISEEREIQELSRYLQHFCSFVITIFLFLAFIWWHQYKFVKY